jgi:hypothetical protein
MKQNFSGTKLKIIESQLENQDKDKHHIRYSDEVKLFTMTLNFLSPKAYRFARTIFTLPCSLFDVAWLLESASTSP